VLARLLTWGSLCLALLVAGLAVPAAVSLAPRAVGPSAADQDGLPLPRTLSGPAAVRALGDDLDVAARLNGMSSDELSTVLTADPSARLDRSGRMFFTDLVEGGPSVITPAPAAAYPYEQTFGLHSLPGANRTIFLDFDGTTVSDTGWNDLGLAARSYPGLDADGLAGFSNDELDIVQAVWQRVAEDYAPFAVDVTTQDPGSAALERANEADQVFGMRALVTSDADAPAILCGNGCQGIAYVDVFDEWLDHPGEWQPVWAFTATAGHDPSFLADIISHEVGHTLGLTHDGQTGVTEYYRGQGIWQPIMGAGFRPLGQWSIGDYTSANNHEDDVAVIAVNGAPLRADDHGGTQGTATSMDSFGPRSGVVSTRTDVDWFAFSQPCPGGSLSVLVTPAVNGPNLDVKLTVANPAGSLTTADPPSGTDPDTGEVVGLDATWTTGNASQGSYKLAVDGVGSGDPLVDGYSDYGSLGGYTIDVDTGCSVTPEAPEAPVGATVTTADDGTSATLSWNPPSSDGGSAVTGYTVMRSGGTPVSLGAAARSHTFTGLTPGTSYTFSVTATNGVGTGPAATAAATTPGPPSAPQDVVATATSDSSIRVDWGVPTSTGGAAITFYTVTLGGSSQVIAASAARTATFNGLAPDTDYVGSVTASNTKGVGPAATASAHTPAATDPPSAPTSLALVDATRSSVTVSWAAPTSDGGLPLQGYQVRRGSGTWVDVPSGPLHWTFTGLAAGTTYQVSVRARNTEGPGSVATLQVATDPPVRPSAPRIGTAASGVAGGTVTATATWAAPTSNGGAAITSYRVTALRMSSTGAVLSRTTKTVGASARRLVMTLRAGKYRFQVVAVNSVGTSRASARSNLATAR